MLHVVITSVGGYAKDDQSKPTVIGAYTNPEVARLVRLCCGSRASVQPIEVDSISIGIREYARKLNVELPK